MTLNNENTRYFDKSWDLFGYLFHREKVLCCSIIIKGKTRAPAVRTGILCHEKKKIQDILTNLKFHLIT